MVAIGLLLISITAVPAWPRSVPGSLDVLIVTLCRPPRSSGEVVGAFRKVRCWRSSGLLASTLAVRYRPLGRAAALARADPRLRRGPDEPGTRPGHWIPKVGRVLALCVTAYVGVTIGWVVVIVLLFPDGPSSNGNFPLYLVMGVHPIGTVS